MVHTLVTKMQKFTFGRSSLKYLNLIFYLFFLLAPKTSIVRFMAFNIVGLYGKKFAKEANKL